MNVDVLICAYGDQAWEDIAWSRAYPSASAQGNVDPFVEGNFEVTVTYDPHATLAEVRNEAASRSDADWLCFLDADDELAPGYLQAMSRVRTFGAVHVNVLPGISKPNGGFYVAINVSLALLAPAVEYIHRGGVKLTPSIPNLGRWPDLNECVIGTLVPRVLFNEIGGFRELPSLEDYDLWLRCVRTGARIVHVPDAVYRAHVSVRGRNSDQTVYRQLRAEHAVVWDT